MANSVSHAALPFPIKGCRYTIGMPFLDADGDPTDPTTPDTEVSIDGAAFTDCTEEETTVSTGFGYITLTGDEMDGSLIMLALKAASGPKTTPVIIYPRVLPALESGTAQAGAAGSITLASGAAAYDLTGCIVKTTGGTGGGGGSGSQGNQARMIVAYNTSTKVATIEPNWETNPSSDTTYDILLTDLAANAPMGRFLRPTTDERTLDVTATGAAGMDWGNVENPTTSVGLSGTTVGTVTANTDMRGTDNAALASVATEARLSELDAANIPADIDTLLTRLTAARAGYLDNLNIGENVAGTSEVTSIQNNTRVVRVVPPIIEVPDSGTQTYRIELLIYDEVGNMEAPDSAPTLTLVNQAGTDRSSRLDSTTMTLVATGHYRVIYTATAGDALEQLIWTFSVVEGSNTRSYGNTSLIVDTTAVDFTAADRTKLEAIHGKIPTNFIMGSSDQDDHDADIDTLVTRIPDTLSLANILTQAATALSNINLDHLMAAAVTGADVVDNSALAKLVSKSATADWDTFVNTTDSLEALADVIITVSAAAIADAVWDELQADHVGAGTFGEIATEIASIISTLASGLTLTSAERTAIANALLDLANAVETGMTVRGALRVALAALAGKAAGLNGTTVTYQNAQVGSKDRITATVDQYGNRGPVTLDMS